MITDFLVQRSNLEIASKHKTADTNSIKDKLQFYSVNIKQTKDKDDAEKRGEGLGKLPKTIDTVGSLLLFNTVENPYKKYVIMDPLAGKLTNCLSFIDTLYCAYSKTNNKEPSSLIHFSFNYYQM